MFGKCKTNIELNQIKSNQEIEDKATAYNLYIFKYF